MQAIKKVRDIFGDPKMCRHTEEVNSNTTLNVYYCKLEIMKQALIQIVAVPCPRHESANEWLNIPDFKYIMQAFHDVRVGKEGADEGFNLALARYLVYFALYRHQMPVDLIERRLEFEVNKLNIILSYYS